ncbi:protein SPIRAL1-like 2 [Miscanthus floridulus]|uniref:protein SPIRAL1-like 2 n=1 Tax=Miscanthus floridulus TaxID=154761 RepID=UPI0034596030
MGRGRGVSYGGGQSSLSYLFGGGGDEPAAAPAKPAAAAEQRAQQPASAAAAAPPAAADGEKQKGIPAGVRGSQTNNYFRAQGQNCGNFLTDRPSTKVHAAPGGGSSLGYLFGGGPPGSK